MYTEIVIKIDFDRKTIGSDNFDILEYMFKRDSNLEVEDLTLPEHEFFKCNRWDSVGNMCSFYHHPNSISDWYVPHYQADKDSVYLFARNDLKNYDSEIEKFFDWLNTLNLMYEDDYIGYSLYEENNAPTIYIIKEK